MSSPYPDAAALDGLVAAAEAVARHAYAPASHFHVGAAVLGDDRQVYAGCNVENASYGLTVCAERNAVAQAVAQGVRRILAVCVWTQTSEPGTPCGACRQVLAEFDPELAMTVVLVGGDGVRRQLSLSELLPDPFRYRRE